MPGPGDREQEEDLSCTLCRLPLEDKSHYVCEVGFQLILASLVDE